MGVLTEIPTSCIHTGKGRFDINPAYDIVLEIQSLYREEGLTNYEKVSQALRMLVKNKWNLKLLNPREKEELLNEIVVRFIRVKKRPQIKKNPIPLFDFEEDGDYIYASFMQEYHIDLIDEQGRLPWKKFLYLFNGLSSETKIKQVIKIRDMEIPVFNGKNGKQIQEINELKSYYALPVRGGGGQSGLDQLFCALDALAK